MSEIGHLLRTPVGLNSAACCRIRTECAVRGPDDTGRIKRKSRRACRRAPRRLRNAFRQAGNVGVQEKSESRGLCLVFTFCPTMVYLFVAFVFRLFLALFHLCFTFVTLQLHLYCTFCFIQTDICHCLHGSDLPIKAPTICSSNEALFCTLMPGKSHATEFRRIFRYSVAIAF